MRLAYPIVVTCIFTLAACTEPNPAYRGGGQDATWQEDGQQTWPDGPGPYFDYALPPDGPGFTCTPGAFWGCSAATKLLQCNAAGDGTVTIDCAPFYCNPVAKRCNQCDPNDKPKCVGSALHSCGKDGLPKVDQCPYGCADGACKQPCTKVPYYKDGDGDGYGDPKHKVEACEKPPGYVENDKDCNDADSKAHPGQSSYYYSPMKGVSSGDPMAFDYNCNNVIEQYRPDKFGSCSYKNGACYGEGWTNSVPACGKWSYYVTCKKSSYGSNSCVKSYSQKGQYCH
jgi:hypothetical protein